MTTALIALSLDRTTAAMKERNERLARRLAAHPSSSALAEVVRVYRERNDALQAHLRQLDAELVKTV